jgi:hypothetical protein
MGPVMTSLIPESFIIASDAFSPVSAGMVALLSAIVVTGFWELLIQEIKLKRLEQKRRPKTATNQNIESDPHWGHGSGIDAGDGKECTTDAKSVQSSMDHFDRAVERLQKLDSNLMGDSTIIDRVTQDLASDLRGVWSARDLTKDKLQGSKDLPVLLHGNGSKGKLRQQRRRRYR